VHAIEAVTERTREAQPLTLLGRLARFGCCNPGLRNSAGFPLGSETTKPTDMHREDRTFAGVRVVREVSANMDDVVAKLRARMGRLTIAAVIDMAQKARSADDFESDARQFIPESGFVIFDEIDHGAWLQIYGLGLKSLRWIFGNPIIAVTMIRHDATAGLFVPMELLFTENPNGEGSAITYVVPSSLIAIDDNPSLLAAAKRLDEKLEALMVSALG
jgi:uncharacterized protein (DUF302 family)